MLIDKLPRPIMHEHATGLTEINEVELDNMQQAAFRKLDATQEAALKKLR